MALSTAMSNTQELWKRKLTRSTIPPNGRVASPLTPSANQRAAHLGVLSVLKFFQQIQIGREFEPSTERIFKLTPREFRELWKELKQNPSSLGYVNDKIRYDWNGVTGQLSVHMPGTTHEKFLQALCTFIERQLEYFTRHSNTEATRDFAKRIEPLRSATVQFADPEAGRSKYCPDASYRLIGARYPGIVIEISHSQDSHSLSRRAEDYVLWSDGEIQLVIGLKIEYGAQSRKASLSTWRPHFIVHEHGGYLETKQDLKETEFRDDMGNLLSIPNFEIALRDFADIESKESLGHVHETIIISSQFLHEALLAAERSDGTRHRTLPPGFTKRKRSPTTGHEITAVDEAQYEEAERRIEKRLEEKDSDYEETSSHSTTSSK